MISSTLNVADCWAWANWSDCKVKWNASWDEPFFCWICFRIDLKNNPNNFDESIPWNFFAKYFLKSYLANALVISFPIFSPWDGVRVCLRVASHLCLSAAFFQFFWSPAFWNSNLKRAPLDCSTPKSTLRASNCCWSNCSYNSLSWSSDISPPYYCFSSSS